MARPKGRALEKRRIEQEEERLAARRAVARRRVALWGALGLVVVGGLALYIVTRPPPPGVEFPDLGNQHLASIQSPHAPYNSSPPSSGPHFGGLFPWGEESQEPVPPELFVHNLEDGGVVLTYDCPEGCPELLEGLREVLGERRGERVMLTPYQGIVDQEGRSHRAAAVAWTRVYYFDELDEESRADLDRFIDLFEGIDHHVRGGRSPLGP